jgi:hypothetical protein
MRFIIMHKTNAHWEAGAIPSAELVARVAGLLRDLQRDGVLLAGEGLRASSEGVRIRIAGGVRTMTNGPFENGNELPAGFSILRARSLDEAIEWAVREGEILGDVEIDIRPVIEAWDIGMAPKPTSPPPRRYIVLRKATAATEAGAAPSVSQRTKLSQMIEETTRAGLHLATEHMRPSARGRRFKNSRDGVTFFDGPFVESKELIAGYVIVSVASLDEAGRWASRYIDVVEAEEVDVRELEPGEFPIDGCRLL